MDAQLLLHERIIQPDGSLIEMKIWQVRKSSYYPLGVRYSLYLVKEGRVLVGYDNHFPKGPHRHYGENEEEYEWVNIEKLIDDFKQDLKRDKHESKNNSN